MSESKRQTVWAFVRLLCMLVTTAFAMFGISVDADALFVGATLILAIASYIWAWWKNNNVTDAATEAQRALDELKTGVDGK